MGKTRDFNDILDECLDRVMKGQDIETILALYPEHAAELEPLLRTARETMQATAVKPRAEFRQRAGNEFQIALRELPPQKAPHAFRWQLRWVAPVAIVVVLLFGGGGTVLAANNALPDSPLYKVKLATEAVQLAFTRSDLGKAELYAKLADKRVEEIVKMSEKGNAVQVKNTTARMDSELIAMANLTSPGVNNVETNYSSMGSQAPAATSSGFPPTETAPTTTAIPETTVPEASATPQTTLTVPPAATGPVSPPVTLSTPENSPTPANPELRHTFGMDNGKNANQAKNANKNFIKNQKLKDDLTRKFQANLKILQDQLAKAPDRLKPALQRAIEILERGYEESISNLEAAGASYSP